MVKYNISCDCRSHNLYCFRFCFPSPFDDGKHFVNSAHKYTNTPTYTQTGNIFCYFIPPINKGVSAFMPLPRHLFVIRLGRWEDCGGYCIPMVVSGVLSWGIRGNIFILMNDGLLRHRWGKGSLGGRCESRLCGGSLLVGPSARL